MEETRSTAEAVRATEHGLPWPFWQEQPVFLLQKLLKKRNWKKGKDPHPQDKIQHLDFTKDPRPLYYKSPPCVFYHKNVCSKAVFGPW